MSTQNTKQDYENAARKSLAAKKTLDWWCIYGISHTDAVYLARLAGSCAKLCTTDLQLGEFLVGMETWREVRASPQHEHIEFDFKRLTREVSRNILDHASTGEGTQLDLVYKQAMLRPREYKALVGMWGKPRRLLFCLREPGSYMATVSKTRDQDLAGLQNHYLQSLEFYLKIGGDVVEHDHTRSPEAFRELLAPLKLATELPAPHQDASQETGTASEAMWEAYHKVKASADAGH